MDNVNDVVSTIETDSALFDILSHFSDDYIDNIITESLELKFRPFNNKLPNYPYLLETNFQAIFDHYAGDNIDVIKDKRYSTFNRIIQVICNYYNLSVTNPISDDIIYPFAFTLNQVFVMEFTQRLIDFFTNYIITNASSFVQAITPDKRAPHTNYAKKIFDNKDKVNYLIIYENMNTIFDMLIGTDIQFNNLVLGLSDQNTANFLTSYLADNGDCYKYHFATYLYNPDYKADMTASIQLNLMKMVLGDNSILNPNNNPFLVDDND